MKQIVEGFVFFALLCVLKVGAWRPILHPRVRVDRSFTGSTRIAWLLGYGLIEVRTPDGKAHHCPTEGDVGFLYKVADVFSEECWKEWATAAAHNDLIFAMRAAGRRRLDFPRQRAVQQELDSFCSVILAEQKARMPAEENAIVLEAA